MKQPRIWTQDKRGLKYHLIDSKGDPHHARTHCGMRVVRRYYLPPYFTPPTRAICLRCLVKRGLEPKKTTDPWGPWQSSASYNPRRTVSARDTLVSEATIMTSYQDAMHTLEQEVVALQDSDKFREYLTLQSKLHAYSFSNTLLIHAQKPNATYVAGFHAWLALGRHVKKGAKGIAIMVPHRLKVETDEGIEQHVSSFGVGYVFDVSDTEGADLPQIDVPVLDGNAGAELFQLLARCSEAEGVSIAGMPPNSTDGVMGYYEPSEKRISVRSDVSQLQQTKTLAHELAHHFDPGIKDYAMTRPECETLAESVAYVVLAHFSLDSGTRSFPYVATWATTPDRFRKVLKSIQQISKRIIDATSSR